MSVFFNDAYMFVKLIIFGKQKKLQYSSLQYINVGLCVLYLMLDLCLKYLIWTAFCLKEMCMITLFNFIEKSWYIEDSSKWCFFNSCSASNSKFKNKGPKSFHHHTFI